MKKILSTSLLKTPLHSSKETIRLEINKLGDMNRNRPANANTKLCDGTPPTQPKVNESILEKLQIPSHHLNSFNFAQMTYGPASGFPFALNAVKNIPEISEICGTHTIILHGGNKTADSIVKRANACSENGQLNRHTLLLSELQKCSPEEKTRLATFLNDGNSIVITLDEVFSSQKHPIRLSAEIIGNKAVADQTIITIGYTGPVLEPMAQWLFTLLRSNPDIQIPENIITKDLKEIAQSFLDYVNFETGCSLTKGLLASGGCSGGLFNVAQALLCKNTIIPTPFFGPQKGILQAANHSVTVMPENTPFSEFKKFLAPGDGNIMLTFPNNPDGKIPTLADMQQLINDAKENGWTLILDTTYFNVVRQEAQENFKAIMQLISTTENLKWVSISSASKALALTKFRAEFITGDSKTLECIEQTIEPINALTVIALEEGLKPENKESFKTHLLENVRLNSEYLQAIAQQSSPQDTNPSLNSGLQIFDKIVKTLKEEFPNESLTIDTGDGALYAKLLIPEALKERFHSLATDHSLALTPSEVFYGNVYSESDNLLIKPQAWYRLSLMSDPLSLPN